MAEQYRQASRRILSLVALALVLALSASAQQSAPDDYAMGTFRMYPFGERALPDPPDGYMPFMISHYGRHGARFHGDDTQGVKVYSVLEEAHRNGMLTELGEELRSYIGLFYRLYEGHSSDLTQKGREQQRELARRMKRNNPSVFTPDTFVEARSTPVPRCILSMGAFCDGLGVWAEQSASKAYMPILAPQLSIPEFEEHSRKSWQTAREEALRIIDPSAFLKRIFGCPDYRITSYPSEVSFMRNVYYLLCNAPCLDVSLPAAPDVFTPGEWAVLWEVNNLVYYVSGYSSDEGVAASAALWEDIVKMADADILSSAPAVRLRFGHDSHLMSLLAFLGVKEWTGKASDLAGVKDVWQDWRIPMAANLQMVFYRHPEKDSIMVRFLLNEQPLELPVCGCTDGFYSWETIKKAYSTP